MVVPPKHPKTVIFLVGKPIIRCWGNPPFKETPHILSVETAGFSEPSNSTGLAHLLGRPGFFGAHDLYNQIHQIIFRSHLGTLPLFFFASLQEAPTVLEKKTRRKLGVQHDFFCKTCIFSIRLAHILDI